VPLFNPFLLIINIVLYQRKVRQLLSTFPSCSGQRIVFTYGELNWPTASISFMGLSISNIAGFILTITSLSDPRTAWCCTRKTTGILYLPECVSLKRYAQWWLFDWVIESRVLWNLSSYRTRELLNESPVWPDGPPPNLRSPLRECVVFLLPI
jgi:hypothetical protein